MEKKINIAELLKDCPKGKNTWEGFHRPFKDGDIITTIIRKNYVFYSIYKNIKDKEIMTYVDYCPNEDRIYNFNGVLCFADEIIEQRLSTEEEKQKLFDAIKENGYKWNAETKTLEKLPKFKVGDRIRKGNPIELEPEDVEIISDDKGDISTTYWNQVRVQASIGAMQVILGKNNYGTYKDIALQAVGYADALVKELKKQ